MSLMTSSTTWWQRARDQGLVDASEPPEPTAEDPNVFIVVLALVGALVCTLSAGALLFSITDADFWLTSPLAYGVSLIGIVGAGAMLHRSRGVFATCLGLVLWGLFTALFLLRVGNQLHHDRQILMLISGVVAVLQLLGAVIAHALWVRRIMGFVFAVALMYFLNACLADSVLLMLLEAGGLLMTAFWVYWMHVEPSLLARAQRTPSLPGWAAFIDSAAVALVLMQAMNYATARLGGGVWYWLMGVSDMDVSEVGDTTLALYIHIMRVFAVALVLAATALVYLRWKRASMAGPRALATMLWAGALLAAAGWFAPSLGLLALVAAGALIGGRWRIAALSALAALWMLGQFYYSLAWPLAQKGLGLALMGALLLAGLYLQRLLLRRKADGDAGALADGLLPVTAWSRARLVCLVAGALLVFGLVNWDVRGKEHVIATGQPVLVPLIPVDPRSLMQGDYMALNFDLPPNVREGLEKSTASFARVLAHLDDKGRATVKRLADGSTVPAAGEVILPLKMLKGHWVLVTDAYFFPEGTGDVFTQARYGDFRVLPDGRALLVGLADENGVPIPVPRAAPELQEQD